MAEFDQRFLGRRMEVDEDAGVEANKIHEVVLGLVDANRNSENMTIPMLMQLADISVVLDIPSVLI